MGSISGLGRSPTGGHGNPLQYSCLENLHGQRSLSGYSPRITKSPTWLSNRTWARTGTAVQDEQGPLLSESQMGPWAHPLCFLLEPPSPLWDFAQEGSWDTHLHTLLWAPHSSFSPNPWSKTSAISSFLSVVSGQPLSYSLSEMLATLPLSLETEQRAECLDRKIAHR